MKASILVGIACLFWQPVWSEEQVLPGTFDYSLGSATVTTLAERQQNVDMKILVGATDEILKRYAPKGIVPNALNAFLIRIDRMNILVDTGLGLKLVDNLKAVKIGPGDIDAVLLTHMHRDHIGGLLRDGVAVFTRATLYIPRPEFEYWKQKSDDMVRTIEAYKGRVCLFQPQEIGTDKPEQFIRGITAFAAYGHTPGHTVFLVEGQSQKLLIWGDITHATPIQIPHPEVTVTYDIDPAQAITTRKRIMAYVATNQIYYVGGMHIAYPGVDFLFKEKEKNNYHIMPVDYTYTNADAKEIAIRSDGYRTETEKVLEGRAKGKIQRMKATNESETWWEITDYVYDADGWLVRKERNKYFQGNEKPQESEEVAYFPMREIVHYIKKTDRDGDSDYIVFNASYQLVARLSGDGKLTKEDVAGNEKYWEPLLKGETASEARARLAKAEQDKAEKEKVANDAAANDIAASRPIKPFVFPKAILDLLPPNLDDALPKEVAKALTQFKNGHFISLRHLSLFPKDLETCLKVRYTTSLEVTVADERGQPVVGAQVTLKQIRLFSDSGDIEMAQSDGRVSDNWEPLMKTERVGASGKAIFKDVPRFTFILLARTLFYDGKMPEPSLQASVKAEGYEEATATFCNVDKETLALAKQTVAIVAGVADDQEVNVEKDFTGAKEAYMSSKLAKTFTVPEENRHDTIQVKIVLKRRSPSTL